MKNREYKTVESLARDVAKTISIMRQQGWKHPKVYAVGASVFVLLSRKVKDEDSVADAGLSATGQRVGGGS